MKIPDHSAQQPTQSIDEQHDLPNLRRPTDPEKPMAIISVGYDLRDHSHRSDPLESKLLAAVIFSIDNFHLPHRLGHPGKRTVVQAMQSRARLN